MPGNGTSTCCGGGGYAASYLEYTYAGGTLDDPSIPGVRILVNMRQHEAAASADSIRRCFTNESMQRVFVSFRNAGQ